MYDICMYVEDIEAAYRQDALTGSYVSYSAIVRQCLIFDTFSVSL